MLAVDNGLWGTRTATRRAHSTQRSRACSIERLENRACLSASTIAAGLSANIAPVETAWAQLSQPVDFELLEHVFASDSTPASTTTELTTSRDISQPSHVATVSPVLDDLFVGTWPQADFTSVTGHWTDHDQQPTTRFDHATRSERATVVESKVQWDDECFVKWSESFVAERPAPTAGVSGWSALWGACATLAGTFASWVWYTNERSGFDETRTGWNGFSTPAKVRVPVRRNDYR